MAAVQAGTPNGLDLDDTPTSDVPDSGMNGGADSEAEEDLFGSEDDAEQNSTQRKLDDSEIDSGDDERRADRLANTVEDEDLMEDKQIAESQTDLAPIRPPEGDELYLLNLPPFLGLAHKNYNPAEYEPPTKPHDKGTVDDADTKFSPFDTATSTLFWRRDPKNPEILQSNARVIRWDDGSLTLQLASKPFDHYRMFTSVLRQNYNPKTNRLYPHAPSDYDLNKDTNNYLVAYHLSQGADLQVMRPFDASVRIQPTGDLADESVLRLQQSLASTHKIHDPAAQLKIVRDNPEEVRRKAEKAEKDAQARIRKVQNAKDAAEFRREQTLRRGGLGGRGGGLSIAGLEDDDGMPTARGRKAQPKKRKTNRRGEIYSDDEDETMPRGRTREDEYDREDDFLADSEEEPEVYGEDEEELLDDEDEDAEGEDDDVAAAPTAPAAQSQRSERPRERRSTTPKRPADDDEGEQGMQGSPQARKKRRVIDDDEDE